MNKFDYKLQMSAPVHCLDGECGKLSKVAIDTSFFEVTHLIVEEGLLMKRARVFPISVLKRIEGNDLYLDIVEDELSNYPEYTETTVERPVVGSYKGSMDVLDEAYVPKVTGEMGMHTIPEKLRVGVPDDLAVVGYSTSIRTIDDSFGKLDCVIVDADSAEILAIVARHGLIFSETETISADWIDSIVNDDIVLKYTTVEVKELLDTPATAVIEGAEEPVVTHTHAGSLAQDVARSLRVDPRTCDAVIEVINDRGVITLVGDVEDPQVRTAAEEITASHPDVVSVVNTLRSRLV